MARQLIIDNQRVHLSDVIKELCKDHKRLSIATGYWDLKAMVETMESLEKLDHIRLLIGREPSIPRNQLSAPEWDFPTRDFKYDLSSLDPSSNYFKVSKVIEEWIRNGKLEVKLYTGAFLHAKAYIFGEFTSNDAVGIIGSSNFTFSGLHSNVELNALESNSLIVTHKPSHPLQETGHLSWYESIWNNEKSVTWNQQFSDLITYSPVGKNLYSPYEMYIRTLSELYEDELQEVDYVSSTSSERSLFDFQLQNANAIIRKLNKHGVAMLADSVGLGKTSTAIRVIKTYLEDPSGKRRVEIICPRSLVNQWEKELALDGILNQSPLSLQNTEALRKREELDAIASVSLFVIDESHNLRESSGIRYKQLSEWIARNPKAHVLMLTATPINNSLSDLTNQILLGTGGWADSMKITLAEESGHSVQVSFHQAVQMLVTQINQLVKKGKPIDFNRITQVMRPIIRTFIVRRTRQGITKEFGGLVIDGKKYHFPQVEPHVVRYDFPSSSMEDFSSIPTETLDLKKLLSLDPDEIVQNSRNLEHPLRATSKLSPKMNMEIPHPLQFIFQIILLLGFVPYRWMMYQTKYYGKTRTEIREMGLDSDIRQKLIQQLSIFGILRTSYLKRMESSVRAFQISLDRYARYLDRFEKGIKRGVIVSPQSIEILDSLEDDQIDDALLDKILGEEKLDDVDDKKYSLPHLIEDIHSEKELLSVLKSFIELLGSEDVKLKAFQKLVLQLRKHNPNRKILVFSYFADTVEYLRHQLTLTENPFLSSHRSQFLSSKNRNEAETFASRFSPKAKRYQLKNEETELDFLFSTDVLSEGQNLQDADVLVNYDLHWNPVRMIQRNGRINRLGSEFKEVQILNMSPEKSLEAYLKLIQRLQAKIDIIKNTIGTDTPVLDEVENPIEYIDSISDIYSNDLLTRMAALEKAEKASDFMLSEDEFISDLRSFLTNSEYSTSYKEEILSISFGKYGEFPNEMVRERLEYPECMVLARVIDEEGEVVDRHFVEVLHKSKQIRLLDNLEALELLKTSPEDNKRGRDNLDFDRNLIRELVEGNAHSYSRSNRDSPLIGQEIDVLRIMWELKYSQEDIEDVREAFKTDNVLQSSDIRKLKSAVMKKKNKNQIFQAELRALVARAHEIRKLQRKSEVKLAIEAKVCFGFINRRGTLE